MSFLDELKNVVPSTSAIILNFVSIEIKTKGWVAVHIDPFANSFFGDQIDSSDDDVESFFFDLQGELIVFRGKPDAMSARWRVVLNENHLVISESGIICFSC